MIVTFKTQPQGQSSDPAAAYVNFLRCVTAIMTAPAGTTSLTVNPYTASNTINTNFNCIVSIDSNAESGGWTTSTSHAVPSSGNNTPTTFSALTGTTFQYKADFYKSSGKSDASAMYLKMSFHTYNNYGGAASWSLPNGTNSPNTTHVTRQNIAAQTAANILITYGHSSTTAWSSGFSPANGGDGGFNLADQPKSMTMNSDCFGGAGTTYNAGPGLC